MWWIVCLVLLGGLGRALAQDTPAGSEMMEADEARRASDQAIVRFNTNIQAFPTWEKFAAAVLGQVVPGTRGTCYTYEGGTVQVTMEPVPLADGATGWRKTSGDGWLLVRPDRTFIEYRLNAGAGILLWREGAKPAWFFASTRKMCEVPLAAMDP
jgi:hypothetical protein